MIITREFTKEQLIARINQVTAINKFRISRDSDANGLVMDNELARIALASLEADAVAYVDPHAFHNFSVFRTGETDNKRMGREWMWANPDVGLIPVYTATPAPVVPDELLSAMEEVLRISDRDHEAWNHAKSAISACRAAMQGKAEAGNSQVIPDGYCIMPTKLTAGNGAKGALSGEFHVTHRIICQSCGGEGCENCNEDGGWDAEIPIGWDTIKRIHEAAVEACALPAAPQQEVKS